MSDAELEDPLYVCAEENRLLRDALKAAENRAALHGSAPTKYGICPTDIDRQGALLVLRDKRIAELEDAINAFLVTEDENYHDCTPAMDDAIDVLREVVDWHRKALEAKP